MRRKSSSIQTIVFYSLRIWNTQIQSTAHISTGSSSTTTTTSSHIHSIVPIIRIMKYPLILLILDYIVFGRSAPLHRPKLHNTHRSLIFNSINPIKCTLMHELLHGQLIIWCKTLERTKSKDRTKNENNEIDWCALAMRRGREMTRRVRKCDISCTWQQRQSCRFEIQVDPMRSTKKSERRGNSPRTLCCVCPPAASRACIRHFGLFIEIGATCTVAAWSQWINVKVFQSMISAWNQRTPQLFHCALTTFRQMNQTNEKVINYVYMCFFFCFSRVCCRIFSHRRRGHDSIEYRD